MSQFATIDILAFSFFFIAWIGYAIAIERASLGSNSLNARMNIYREVWMRLGVNELQRGDPAA